MNSIIKNLKTYLFHYLFVLLIVVSQVVTLPAVVTWISLAYFYIVGTIVILIVTAFSIYLLMGNIDFFEIVKESVKKERSKYENLTGVFLLSLVSNTVLLFIFNDMGRMYLAATEVINIVAAIYLRSTYTKALKETE